FPRQREGARPTTTTNEHTSSDSLASYTHCLSCIVSIDLSLPASNCSCLLSVSSVGKGRGPRADWNVL
ncbi:MAG: hypothetical protein ACPIOQ_56965, partial [Promethearchaeia archaeon]